MFYSFKAYRYIFHQNNNIIYNAVFFEIFILTRCTYIQRTNSARVPGKANAINLFLASFLQLLVDTDIQHNTAHLLYIYYITLDLSFLFFLFFLFTLT